MGDNGLGVEGGRTHRYCCQRVGSGLSQWISFLLA